MCYYLWVKCMNKQLNKLILNPHCERVRVNYCYYPSKHYGFHFSVFEQSFYCKIYNMIMQWIQIKLSKTLIYKLFWQHHVSYFQPFIYCMIHVIQRFNQKEESVNPSLNFWVCYNNVFRCLTEMTQKSLIESLI